MSLILYKKRNTEYGIRNTEKGVILLLTFIFMVVLSIITIAFLFMISTQTKGRGYDIISHKALWLAEAGIQQVLYQLKNDAGYRNSPATVTESLGSGSYSVCVSKDGDIYTLSSTGTVDVLSRQIEQTVEVAGEASWDFAEYMLYFGTTAGNYSIGRDSVFSGSIFVKGNLTIDRDSTIDGDVLATGNITLGRDVTVTGDVLPGSEAPATMPALDTATYDAQIATAATYPSGNRTFSGVISGTNYVNGKATINGNISGTGTIVATGDVVINEDMQVGDSITLIAGDELKAKEGYLIGDHCTLYASTEVSLAKSGTFGSASIGSVIISPQDVVIKENNKIYGLVFAADQISIGKDSEVTGNVAGGRINSIARDNVYTLDNDLVDFSSIAGFSAGASGEVTVTPQKDWNEVVPAI